MGLFSDIASIFGGGQKAKGAKNAADAQIAYNNKGIDALLGGLSGVNSSLAPWLSGGQSANSAMLNLLGLGGGGPFDANNINSTADYILKARPDVANSQWLSSLPDSEIGDQNGDGVVDSRDRAVYWAQKGYAQNEGLQLPSTSAADAQQAAIDNLKASPLYQSLYRNGSDAILANASATGGLRGGNVQNSLANFGADTLASVIQQQLSNLSGVSSLGQNTALGEGNLDLSTLGKIAGLDSANGDAAAGGILGKTLAHLGQTTAVGGLGDQLASAAFGAYSPGGGGTGAFIKGLF